MSSAGDANVLDVMRSIVGQNFAIRDFQFGPVCWSVPIELGIRSTWSVIQARSHTAGRKVHETRNVPFDGAVHGNNRIDVRTASFGSSIPMTTT